MAIALAFSWSMWILYAASMAGRLPFQVPAEIALLGEYGPTFAAFVLPALDRSKGGVRDLLQRMVRWRVQPRWYAFVVLVTPLLMLTTMALTVAVGGTPPELAQLAQWPEHFRTRTSALSPSMGLLSGLSAFMSTGTWATALGMILLGVCQGGLSEEPGWRGFALPRARTRFNLLTAALIVGALWAAWHTGPEQWLLLFKSGFVAFIQAVLLNVLQYLFLTLPLAVLYAWVYANTGGSVLLSVLFHAAYNITISITLSGWPTFPIVTFFALCWALAIGVVVLARKQFSAFPGQPASSASSPSMCSPASAAVAGDASSLPRIGRPPRAAYHRPRCGPPPPLRTTALTA